MYTDNHTFDEMLVKLRIYFRINGILVRNPRIQPYNSISELYEICKTKIWDGSEDPELIEKVFNQLLVKKHSISK